MSDFYPFHAPAPGGAGAPAVITPSTRNVPFVPIISTGAKVIPSITIGDVAMRDSVVVPPEATSGP